ncbi:flagellar assembly protein A [Thiovibrio sp. JS02]
MVQSSVTVEAQNTEDARTEGARLLKVPTAGVDVAEIGAGRYQVSVRNLPGRFEVVVQPDKLAAFLKVITPPLGNGRPVSAEDVLLVLAGKNIVFGIDNEAIAQVVALARETGSPESNVCIARGVPAIAGANGRVELKVGLGAANPAPEAADMVRPGQVVAVRIPAASGTAGTDVFGEVIPAGVGAESVFTAGVNVHAEEDGLSFVADIYGRASASRESILVINPVRLSEDKMSAYLPIQPVMADNSRLTAADVKVTLAAAGVVHGILEEAISAALARDTPIAELRAAAGSPARDGVDAQVKFAFRLHGQNPAVTDQARQTGVLAEKSLVRELVLGGDVLVKKVPLVEPVAGSTVIGEILAGQPAGDLAITPGENVAVIDDGLTFIVAEAIVAGYADYADGVVAVLDPVRISEDNMRAFLTVHPPGRGGMGLSMELVERLLARHQIVFGVSRKVVQKALAYAAEKNRVLHDVVVARGTTPVAGRDAEIEMHISLGKIAGVSSETGDRLDYRERNLINNVKAGEVIARKIPAGEGQPGHDVLGRELPAEPGLDRQLLPQANVAVSEDGLVFTAQTGGMVSLIDKDKIAVFQVYEIKGDVDYATGNLDMEGALAIKGWVRSGFTVRASGDVLIGGGVEDGLVSSGANVKIAGGVICLEHGRVKAQGDVSVKFLERARVHAGGNIYIHDEAMRSFISAGGTLSAVAGRGRIRGGTVSAIQGIEVNEVGSAAGVRTVLMAGTNPVLKRRIAALNKQINGYRRERAKMDTVLARYLGHGKGANLPKDVMRKLSLLAKQRRNLAQAEAHLARPRDELARELAAIDLKAIRVIIRKAVYVGTTIVIGGQIHKVAEDIRRPAVFLLDEAGRIVMR